MRVISVIKDEAILENILKHHGLWDRKAKPPPKATGPPEVQEHIIDYSMSQLPCLSDVACEEGGSDKWLAEGHVFSVIDPEYPEVYPP